MTPEEVKQQLESMYDHLVEEEGIYLYIRVQSREAAKQIVDWMFSGNKPMLADLLEVAWDKELVSKKDADAIRNIREG